MRKLTVLEHITLDGVIQGPGGLDEDTSGGFAKGGWIAPYGDAMLWTAVNRQLSLPIDLLLGRKTFDLWASYWPQHGDRWPRVNAATKYVASRTRRYGDWQPSVFLNGDVVKQVADLKQQDGANLHVWGSGDLLQTLLQHDLIDAFWLMTYPIALGEGIRLFVDGKVPATFKVTESTVTSKGVVIANYQRAGAVSSGSL